MESLIRKQVLEMTEGDSVATSKNLRVSPGFVELVKSVGDDDTAAGKEIYNYCLLNHYRSGEDRMGYHADDEASLDPRVPIASVSLGTARLRRAPARRGAARGAALARGRRPLAHVSPHAAALGARGAGGEAGGGGEDQFDVPPAARGARRAGRGEDSSRARPG